MGDIAYSYKAFEDLFRFRNIGNNGSNMIFLDFMNFIPSPNTIKQDFTQTRLIEYLYNSDNITLAYSNFFNNSHSGPMNKTSHIYYLLYKNKYLGMTFKTTDFKSDSTFSEQPILDLFDNIYNFKESIYTKKNISTNSFDYFAKRGCNFENITEKSQFLFQNGDLSNTLYIPGNIDKCKAMNIAYLQNDIINDNNQQMIVNLYFLNPVTLIIFNYQIQFTRKFTFGLHIF